MIVPDAGPEAGPEIQHRRDCETPKPTWLQDLMNPSVTAEQREYNLYGFWAIGPSRVEERKFRETYRRLRTRFIKYAHSSYALGDRKLGRWMTQIRRKRKEGKLWQHWADDLEKLRFDYYVTGATPKEMPKLLQLKPCTEKEYRKRYSYEKKQRVFRERHHIFLKTSRMHELVEQVAKTHYLPAEIATRINAYLESVPVEHRWVQPGVKCFYRGEIEKDMGSCICEVVRLESAVQPNSKKRKWRVKVKFPDIDPKNTYTYNIDQISDPIEEPKSKMKKRESCSERKDLGKSTISISKIKSRKRKRADQFIHSKEYFQGNIKPARRTPEMSGGQRRANDVPDHAVPESNHAVPESVERGVHQGDWQVGGDELRLNNVPPKAENAGEHISQEDVATYRALTLLTQEGTPDADLFEDLSREIEAKRILNNEFEKEAPKTLRKTKTVTKRSLRDEFENEVQTPLLVHKLSEIEQKELHSVHRDFNAKEYYIVTQNPMFNTKNWVGLVENEWLKDDIIDGYMALLVASYNQDKNSQDSSIFAHKTRFYEYLMQKQNSDENERNKYSYKAVTTRPSNLHAKMDDGNPFYLGKLLIPINLSNSHWVLVVVDFKTNTITHRDSKDGRNGMRSKRKMRNAMIRVNNIEQYLRDSYRDFKKNTGDSDTCMPLFNKIHYPQETPQQPDNVNCGVYICAFMKMEMLGLPVTDFNKTMIPDFRNMMAMDLLRKTGRLERRT